MSYIWSSWGRTSKDAYRGGGPPVWAALARAVAVRRFTINEATKLNFEESF